jgi:nucleoid-associated protein YgaU
MAKSVYERFGSSALTGNAQSARRYTVVGGDTLPKIAALVYPDDGYSSEDWRQLAEFNGITDLDALTVGTVLTIPTLQSSST